MSVLVAERNESAAERETKSKEREWELKCRELELREKELELRKSDTVDVSTSDVKVKVKLPTFIEGQDIDVFPTSFEGLADREKFRSCRQATVETYREFSVHAYTCQHCLTTSMHNNIF